MEPDKIKEAIRAAFEHGCAQGADEAVAFEWGSRPNQSRGDAFSDFMADWEDDSKPLRDLLSTPMFATNATEIHRRGFRSAVCKAVAAISDAEVQEAYDEGCRIHYDDLQEFFADKVNALLQGPDA